jgi:hypothetical protein
MFKFCEFVKAKVQQQLSKVLFQGASSRALSCWLCQACGAPGVVGRGPGPKTQVSILKALFVRTSQWNMAGCFF